MMRIQPSVHSRQDYHSHWRCDRPGQVLGLRPSLMICSFPTYCSMEESPPVSTVRCLAVIFAISRFRMKYCTMSECAWCDSLSRDHASERGPPLCIYQTGPACLYTFFGRATLSACDDHLRLSVKDRDHEARSVDQSR